MIRKATLGDIAAIVGISRKLAEDRYPSMVFSKDKVEEHLKTAISGASNWASVSGGTDGVSGCLICVAYDTLWAERQTAAITMFYAEVPGDGEAMMRAFLRWVKTRRIIKQVELGVDNKVDPRIGRLLQRFGFSATDTVYRKFR